LTENDYVWRECPSCRYETIFPNNPCLKCGAEVYARILTLAELRQRGFARDPDEAAIAADDKPKKKRWYKK
jgi:hypothetical protein